MDFIDYTLNWCKGEIFEGRMLALFGVIVLIIAMLYWAFGNTSFAKAMIIPFLVLGCFYTSGGLGVVYTNKQRIVSFEKQFNTDEAGFVEAEKERIEFYLRRYPAIMWGMAATILVGLCCFLLWSGPYGRAVGLALILFGFSTLFLDHFSEERAKNYHHVIVNNGPDKGVEI